TSTSFSESGKWNSALFTRKRGPVDIRFVPVRPDNSGLKVVGDQGPGNPTDILQAAAQSIQEVPDALGGNGHGKAVVGKRQAGNKQLATDDFTCLPVGIADLFPGEVNKQPVGGLMAQHGSRLAGNELLLEMEAELGIAIALGEALDIFFP